MIELRDRQPVDEWRSDGASFLNRLIERRSWMEHSACRGKPVDTFFPGRGNSQAMNAALAICRECPVINDCLEYALTLGLRSSPGVWGGQTERQRRTMRARRNREQRVASSAERGWE